MFVVEGDKAGPADARKYIRKRLGWVEGILFENSFNTADAGGGGFFFDDFEGAVDVF